MLHTVEAFIASVQLLREMHGVNAARFVEFVLREDPHGLHNAIWTFEWSVLRNVQAPDRSLMAVPKAVVIPSPWLSLRHFEARSMNKTPKDIWVARSARF